MNSLYPPWFCGLSVGNPISVFRTQIMKQEEIHGLWEHYKK